ncbi:MAG: hypothetical protein K2N64_07590 [Anaeroplasmataceae bacterium]|nr:hypothetical protein [Anaeroplasmataceae bacterium]
MKKKSIKYYTLFIFASVFFLLVGLGGIITHAAQETEVDTPTIVNETIEAEESGIMPLAATKDFGGGQACIIETFELTYETFSEEADSRYELGIRISSPKFQNYNLGTLFNLQTSRYPIVTSSAIVVDFVEPGTYQSIPAYDYSQITNVEGVELEAGFYSIQDDFDILVHMYNAQETQAFDQAWCEIYEVYDVKAPVIGGTVNISVNVDSQPSIDELLSHVYAIDETDGRVPVTATSSTYTPGEMEVGTYTIEIEASDKSGNTSTGVITVYRYDDTAPVFTWTTSSYDLNYDHTVTLDDIIADHKATDNVDSNPVIEVVSDTFTGNEHIVGNYSVTLRATDSSSNKSVSHTVYISVKNGGTPVLAGPSKITTGTNEKLTLEEFKAHYSSTDGYDGDLDFEVAGFDEYLKNAKKVGTYHVTITTTNSANNSNSLAVTIEVEDDSAPGIFYDNHYIMLKQGETLTKDMIINHAARVLQVQASDILEIQGEYDTHVLGDYALEVCMADGETYAFTLAVFNDEDPAETKGFDFDKFFSIEGYTENFFNFKNYQEWSFWIWATYGLGLVIVGLFIFLKLTRRKTSQ